MRSDNARSIPRTIQGRAPRSAPYASNSELYADATNLTEVRQALPSDVLHNPFERIGRSDCIDSR